MNYLTNYYKNLSEQLQEKVNYLKTLLNEDNDPNSNPSKPSGSPQPAGPRPSPAPAPTPTPAQIPPGQAPFRPDPRGYPGGSQDPNYQRDWYEYFKWWQTQDPKWRDKNPLPPPPKDRGIRPGTRPGGGQMPGRGPAPIR